MSFAGEVSSYDFYSQKRPSVIRAIKAKTDLKGQDKHSIKIKFGYPYYRASSQTRQGKKETWTYLPFKRGRLKMKVIFLNGKVMDVEYSDPEEKKKEKQEKTYRE